jgi:hypothetical protein
MGIYEKPGRSEPGNVIISPTKGMTSSVHTPFIPSTWLRIDQNFRAAQFIHNWFKDSYMLCAYRIANVDNTKIKVISYTKPHLLLPILTPQYLLLCFSNRSWRPIGVWEVEAPTSSRQSAHRWRQGCQPYAPAALYPQGIFVVLISVRGWVDPRAIFRLEGLGQLKKKIHLIGTWTRDLPVCSIVPQPTSIFYYQTKHQSWRTRISGLLHFMSRVFIFLPRVFIYIFTVNWN